MAEGGTRRDVLAGLAAAPAFAAIPANAGPSDEAAWAEIAKLYEKPAGVIQLENGNWGVMARPVLAAYEELTRRVNRDASFYTRRVFNKDVAGIKERVAATLGVSADEIAFTRGATEALQALIGGYAGLKPGDGVLLADLDYDAMQTAMRWLKARRGADVIEIALPEPATTEGILAAYKEALTRNPHIKLMLLTHVSHRTGLILPVRAITEMARARGVDVILDSAHAFGQFPFTLPELGADFVGLNLHKWIGAPIGVGLIYIRRARINVIEPYMGEPGPDGAIEARVHTGTSNFAATLAVPAALDLHEKIGPVAKTARLKALQTRWSDAARALPGLEVLTPADPALNCAIGAFRVKGKGSPADNRALAERLLSEFGIFTVARTGIARGAAVRVTPGVFTSAAEIDALMRALRTIAG